MVLRLGSARGLLSLSDHLGAVGAVRIIEHDADASLDRDLLARHEEGSLQEVGDPLCGLRRVSSGAEPIENQAEKIAA